MNFNDLSIKRSLIAAEILIIVVLAAVPLFVTFPYRVNIFLSWEGAYRISQGELPFKDFGTPLGGMYWVIPGLFFKIFGTQMITLVKAQVFINILSGLAFRSILKSLSVETGLRIVCVLLFCLSYSFLISGHGIIIRWLCMNLSGLPSYYSISNFQRKGCHFYLSSELHSLPVALFN